MGGGWGPLLNERRRSRPRRSRPVGPTFVPQSSVAGRLCAAGRVLTCRRKRGPARRRALRHHEDRRVGGGGEETSKVVPLVAETYYPRRSIRDAPLTQCE